MPKIGRDVINKKGAILSGKDAEDFERFQEEQLAKEEEREEKPKSQVELKSKMPEEPEPTTEQINKAMAEEAVEKEVFVNEHYRRKPKRTEEEE
jgi:hypothetical protein